MTTFASVNQVGGLLGPDAEPILVQALTTNDVCQAIALPRATLNSWVEAELIRPSVAAGAGKRVPRYWSAADLVTVRAVAVLRAAGCPADQLMEVGAWVRAAWAVDWPDHILVWDGSSLQLLRALDLTGLIRSPEQRVVQVVSMPVGAWRSDALQRAAIAIDIAAVRASRVPRQRRTSPPRRSRVNDYASEQQQILPLDQA